MGKDDQADQLRERIKKLPREKRQSLYDILQADEELSNETIKELRKRIADLEKAGPGKPGSDADAGSDGKEKPYGIEDFINDL